MAGQAADEAVLLVERIWAEVYGAGVPVSQTATAAEASVLTAGNPGQGGAGSAACAAGASGSAACSAAIARSLARAGLLRPPTSQLVSVEFGSGHAAALSVHVRRAAAENGGGGGGPELRQILVDRKPEPGVSSAAAHQQAAAGGDASALEGAERLTTEIGDLDLPSVLRSAGDTSSTAPVIGMAQHLCGSGTDLALQALGSVAAAGGGRSVSVAFVSCCHGACGWSSYVNREFFASHATTAIDGEQTFECVRAVAGSASVVYREVTAAVFL